jgi:putative transposase
MVSPIPVTGHDGPRSHKSSCGWKPEGRIRTEAGGMTYLLIIIRSVWLYPYSVIDVWSRKKVTWEVAEREEADIASDLFSRTCLRVRISNGRPNPLTLHVDNGNAMPPATLESRLKELGVLRSFLRLRISNVNPYSESLFCTLR